jgi:hypothetical protein
LDLLADKERRIEMERWVFDCISQRDVYQFLATALA